MDQHPSKEARRVFLIIDNGSPHPGQKPIKSLHSRHIDSALVHGPIHASRINRIEIYLSTLQRKALTPNAFPSLAALKDRILTFQEYYEKIGKPFKWKFTRKALIRQMCEVNNGRADQYRLAA